MNPQSAGEADRRLGRSRGRWLWRLALYVLDVAVVIMATALAYYARFEGAVPATFARLAPWWALAAALTYGLLFTAFGLHRLVLRYVGVDTLLRLAAATFVGFSLLLIADVVAPESAPGTRAVPFGVLFIQALLVFLGCAAVRLAVRIMLLVQGRAAAGRRVLIVGAGSAGSLLLREIQQRPDLGLIVVGFLDDDPRVHGRTVGGVRVLGTTSQLPRVAGERGVQEVLVALPSAPRETVRRVLNSAADAGLETRIMPPVVMARGAVSLTDLRKVEVEDLLGREATPIDVDQIAETIAGKVVAVTGAAGSIGSELCRQAMTLGPKRLLLIEIDETRLYELWLELKRTDPNVPMMCVCDIRDQAKLDALFAAERPQLVLHAAAYKHVPVMELAPAEAVKTNVLGTKQVIEASERFSAERFVLVSTDKAVMPANVMGFTKSVAERVMLEASHRGKLVVVAVRFGNVLASRGSVVPIFEEELRRGGPLTVTDPEVTRYFMTIPEAARLILQAQAIGQTGDIFVLEMGEPVRIVDLAKRMIALSGVPADLEFVGLRPGEKLHETLVDEYEILVPTGREKILRVKSTPTLPADFDEALKDLIEAALRDRSDDLDRAIGALDPAFVSRQANRQPGEVV